MIDLAAISQAVAKYGKVARVVLAQVQGSAPRSAGTSMLIWEDGSADTIGGGQLELQSMDHARVMLGNGTRLHLRRAALGPTLNQCCGGAVAVVTEVFDAAALAALPRDFEGIFARCIGTDATPLPGALARKLRRATGGAAPLPFTYQEGWLAEATWRARQQVVIYGAGHVGRALANVLTPLPQFDVQVCDLRHAYLDDLPEGIQINRALPTEVMAKAPEDAQHFIMTPEHDYDLELCHHLLGRRFGYAGLIGSATKWARFRKRLAALGHAPAQIARITCPIGDPSLGKHPQAIALGIAAHMLSPVLTHRKESIS
jgi:xanthine dehydrogenase accessory factor